MFVPVEYAHAVYIALPTCSTLSFSSAKPLAILNLEHFLYSLKVELFAEKKLKLLVSKVKFCFKKTSQHVRRCFDRTKSHLSNRESSVFCD